MTVLELKGFKSLRAMNAFHTLMLGLKMLPSYLHETYEEFFKRIEKMSKEDQKKMITEATLFVELQKEEVESLLCFCADKNGVPYSSENLRSLTPDQIMDIIVAVCCKIAEIKIDFVSDDEKKN